MKSIIYRCGALLAIVLLSSIKIAPVCPLHSAQLLSERSLVWTASGGGVGDGAGSTSGAGDAGAEAVAGEEGQPDQQKDSTQQ